MCDDGAAKPLDRRLGRSQKRLAVVVVVHDHGHAFGLERLGRKVRKGRPEGTLRTDECAEDVARGREDHVVTGGVQQHKRHFLARDKLLRRDHRGGT